MVKVCYMNGFDRFPKTINHLGKPEYSKFEIFNIFATSAAIFVIFQLVVLSHRYPVPFYCPGLNLARFFLLLAAGDGQ